MGYHDHLNLWGPLDIVSDSELLDVTRECMAFLGGRARGPHLRPGITEADACAARQAIELELQQRGIGGEPWWTTSRPPRSVHLRPERRNSLASRFTRRRLAGLS